MSAAAPAPAALAGPPYTRSGPVLSFIVHGAPKPQGSKNVFQNPKTGKLIVTESSKALKPWRQLVTATIHAARLRATPPPDGWPLLGPLALDLVFTMPKPKSAPKTRPTWPAVYPDVDKLARAVFDAGTHADAWGDDSQIVDMRAAKVYPNEAPGALSMPGVYAVVYRVGPEPAPDVHQADLFGSGMNP